MNSLDLISPTFFESWDEVNGYMSEKGFVIDVDVDTKELIVVDSTETYCAVFNLGSQMCHGALCSALNDLFGFTLFWKE